MWWMRTRSITITISSLRFPSLTITTTVSAPPASMSFLNALYAPIQCTPQSIRFVFFFGYFNIFLCWTWSICFQLLCTFYLLFYFILFFVIIVTGYYYCCYYYNYDGDSFLIDWAGKDYGFLCYNCIALGMLRLDKEQNALPNRRNCRWNLSSVGWLCLWDLVGLGWIWSLEFMQNSLERRCS